MIGYYVYTQNDGVAPGGLQRIREGETNSYSIGSGSYFVRAVDITGLQSEPSNTITIEKEEKRKSYLPKRKTPDDPPDGGSIPPPVTPIPPGDGGNEDDEDPISTGR